MKKIISIAICIAMMLTMITIPAFASETKTYGYDNLNNEEGNLVIGFIGGSITVADGDNGSLNRYSTRVTQWFGDRYPNKSVTEVNAGIGGTASDWGKYRVANAVGAYSPDVVFVEFAVNDAHLSKVNAESVRSNMESLVRSLQSLPKEPVIVFLYSAHDDSYANLEYTAIPQHQQVADYYGIESIDFYQYVKDEVADGRLVWDSTAEGTLTDDNIHPNAAGHEEYASFIINKLENEDILHKNIYRNGSKFDFTQENPRDVSFDDVTKTGSWVEASVGQSDGKADALGTSASGDTLTLSFDADTVGIVPLSGTATWIVDEGTDTETSGSFTGNGTPVIFATGLNEGTHTVKVTATDAFKTGRFVLSGGVVKADATVDANGNHLPSAVPENRFLDNGNGNAYSKNTSSISLSIYDDDYSGLTGGIYKIQPVSTLSNTASGLLLSKATSDTATRGLFKPTGKHEAGKTYVIKAKVRALSGSPRIGTAFEMNWSPTFDNEYGSAGFAPTTEWCTYKATITPKTVGDMANSVNFGLMPSCTTEDAVLFDFSNGFYLAEEIAWDIEVESKEGTLVPKGGTIEFDASLINQIGTEGTLPQNFVWAFADSEAAASAGLTLTTEGTGAKISASEDATEGNYVLTVVSTDKNWKKTINVSVGSLSIIPDTKDYVAGEEKLTDNLIVGATDGNVLANRNWAFGDLTDSAGPVFAYTEKAHAPAGDIYYGYAGPTWFQVGTGSLKQNITPGVNYAVSVNLANGAPEKQATIKAAIGHMNCTKPLRFDVSSGETQTYTGILSATAETESLTFGFDGSVDRRDRTDDTKGVLIFDASAGANSFYVSPEKAYNIVIKGDKTEFVSGDSFNLEATILNQIDTEGNLNQNFTWLAVNSDRTQVIENISIAVNGEDSSLATVTIGDVASGEYIVVAQSSDYSMARHYPIKIKGTIENTNDYVPSGEKLAGNLIVGATDGNVLANRNWAFGDLTDSAGPVFAYTEKAHAPAGDIYYGYAGPTWFQVGTGSLKQNITPGVNYAVSVNLANGAPEKQATIKAAIGHMNCTKPLRFDVSSGETQTYTGILSATAETESLTFGFDGSVDRRDRTDDTKGVLIFDATAGANSLYVAEEVAYDIAVDGAKDSIFQGDAMELEASVLNQIDLEGGLNQEFSWVAVNKDRTEYAEGITLTYDDEDSSKVMVEIDDTVPTGDYIIVAQSSVYGMNRQFPIAVTEAPEYDVKTLTLETSSAGASLTALTVNANTDVVVVLAAYSQDTKILEDCNRVVLTPVEGVASLESALEISGLSSGSCVRVLVWDKDMKPFSMKNAYKLPITIE